MILPNVPRVGDQVYFRSNPGQPLPVPNAAGKELAAIVAAILPNGMLVLHVIAHNGTSFGADGVPPAAAGKAVGWYWPPHIRV